MRARAQKRKSARRLNRPLRAQMRAHARAHWPVQLALCLRTCARASALLACFPHTVKKMPASQHRFPSLLLRKCLLLRKQSFSSFSSFSRYFHTVSKLKYNSDYWKIAGLRPSASGLLFSGEILETGSIHNSGYWKIAGLCPAIFRGTLGNWGHP